MSIKVDGKYYEDETLSPDLGSWVCTGSEDNRRTYEGLSADIAKLPTYDDLGTGSTAICSDNGDFLKYEATTKSWYEWQEIELWE